MTVGTKDLKNRLSHYLRRVKAGDVVRVTDRGRVIAEIRAIEQPRDESRAALAALESAGALTVGSGRFAPVRRLRLRGVLASRAILADRG
jgi:antitoxin (DNA-binding transcriptional repressor) of toxin-antitoxin stability system